MVQQNQSLLTPPAQISGVRPQTDEDRLAELARDAQVSPLYLKTLLLPIEHLDLIGLQITSFEQAIHFWDALKETKYADDIAEIMESFIGPADILRKHQALSLFHARSHTSEDEGVLMAIIKRIWESLSKDVNERLERKDAYSLKMALSVLPKNDPRFRVALMDLAKLRGIQIDSLAETEAREELPFQAEPKKPNQRRGRQ